MNPILSDIRILKLAEMYERAYEGFVLEMVERHVKDDSLKTRLRALAAPTDGHGERIAAHIERLNRRLGAADSAMLERAALLDVLEVERSARSFYLRFVEEVHDPDVAALFRELAREETNHVRLAEDAVALHDRKAGRIRMGFETERSLRLLDAPPLWEGSSDFGPTRSSRAPGASEAGAESAP